jgi:hypothetical protein
MNKSMTAQEPQPRHVVQAQQQLPFVDAAHAPVQRATLTHNVAAVNQ